MPPLALALLCAILALPFVYYILPDPRVGAGFAADQQETVLRWSVPEGDADSPPVRNLETGPSGRPSIRQAPQVLPVETYGPGTVGFVPDQPVAPDVARFVAARPREEALSTSGDRIATCTLEGEATYNGKVVLIDGCLRFQRSGTAEPGPLILGHYAVFRDARDYLTIGSRDGRPEAALRVGEPGAVLRGVGCSKDGPVPAPKELAALCGVREMIRIGSIRRASICSEDRIAALVEQAEHYRIVDDTLRARRAECLARNGQTAPCPPGAAPMSPDLAPECRMPPEGSARIERAMRPAS